MSSTLSENQERRLAGDESVAFCLRNQLAEVPVTIMSGAAKREKVVAHIVVPVPTYEKMPEVRCVPQD